MQPPLAVYPIGCKADGMCLSAKRLCSGNWESIFFFSSASLREPKYQGNLLKVIGNETDRDLEGCTLELVSKELNH